MTGARRGSVHKGASEVAVSRPDSNRCAVPSRRHECEQVDEGLSPLVRSLESFKPGKPSWQNLVVATSFLQGLWDEPTARRVYS